MRYKKAISRQSLEQNRDGKKAGGEGEVRDLSPRRISMINFHPTRTVGLHLTMTVCSQASLNRDPEKTQGLAREVRKVLKVFLRVLGELRG